MREKCVVYILFQGCLKCNFWNNCVNVWDTMVYEWSLVNYTVGLCREHVVQARVLNHWLIRWETEVEYYQQLYHMSYAHSDITYDTTVNMGLGLYPHDTYRSTYNNLQNIPTSIQHFFTNRDLSVTIISSISSNISLYLYLYNQQNNVFISFHLQKDNKRFMYLKI